MNRRQWLTHSLAAVGCCTALGCDTDDSTDLQGAGATFPAPLYKRWFLEFYHRNPQIRVNYQAVGSGAGVRQFSSDLLDFGASDAAMTDAEIKKAIEQHPQRKGVLLLPMTAGSVSICYNVPGVTDGLRLSRKVYTDIFLGKIDTWNAPAIATLNLGKSLPDLPITVVRRADGSGTTFAFTNHMSAASPEWKSKVGVGKAVTWPVGIGGKGNAGVAALIQQTPGAVGYLETGYAEVIHLPMAQLQNKAGEYVLPTLESGQAALRGLTLPPNLRLWVPDPVVTSAYPIVTYSWVLCFKDYSDKPKQAEALRNVLRYGLADGQKFSEELGYIPLPPEVVSEVLKAVDQIKS